MGQLHQLQEHVSYSAIFLVLIVGLVLKSLITYINENRRIKKLGVHAPVWTSYLPLGLDSVLRLVFSLFGQKSLLFWNDVLFAGSTRSTTAARLLTRRVIFTADPENIKAVLAGQFHDYGKGAAFHSRWWPFLGDGIFTTDGELWHSARQMIRPQFTRDRLSDLECFESHVQTLLRVIANGGPLDGENQVVDLAAANGKVVELTDIFFRYTLDITTEFLMGSDVKSLSTRKQEFAEAFNTVQRYQMLYGKMMGLRRFAPTKPYYDGIRVMDSFISHFIQLALRLTPEELAERSKSDRDYTFLHELAMSTRDPKVIRDQIICVLLAGRDTSAATLSWAFYELGRHPEVVAKLRAEILAIVGPSEAPTYERLKNMPYLKAILNETLRLYPAVPYNTRVALADNTLPRGGGPNGDQPIGVLAGTQIIYSPFIMHRRKELYPPVSEKFADPAVFSPDRWSVWHPKPHEYIPFNAGPRICIGQQFALMEMSYTLCRIFQRFERVQSFMHQLDGGEPQFKTDIILSPGQGVHVAFWEPQEVL